MDIHSIIQGLDAQTGITLLVDGLNERRFVFFLQDQPSALVIRHAVDPCQPRVILRFLARPSGT